MRNHWTRSFAFSLFLSTAIVVSAQTTAAVTQNAAGQTTKGKLISLGTTSLESPKTAMTATPAAQASPKQMMSERALMKLMYKANARVLMPNIAEKAKAANNTSVGFGGSAFTVNGLDNVDNSSVNGGDLEPPDQGFCAGSNQLFEVINLGLRRLRPGREQNFF